MTFKQNIARFITGDIGLRSIPDISIEAMEQGLDSPSLRILAGLSENENQFVIDKYLKDTLKELSIVVPDKRQAAIELALAIADEIFEGKTDVFEGTKDIRTRAIMCYPFFEESKNYCYDSIGFEKAYGLFDNIDDLQSAGTTQWQPDKTNEQLELELRTELLVELKQWSLLTKNGSLQGFGASGAGR